MLEATQALLTTASVLLIVRGVLAARVRDSVLPSAGAAVAMAAAFLTKGPVGLFPLAVPALAILLLRPARPSLPRIAIVWITLLITAGALGGMILAIPDARHALAEFGRTHVVPVLQGERGLPRRSFDIARHFTLGILARMGALAVVLWLIRPRGRGVPAVRWNAALFFFGVGLIASVPLLASPVLAGHYFVPSVPFFALAVAASALPAVQGYRERTNGPVRFIPIGIAAALVLLAALVLVLRGPMEKRDADLVAAIQRVGAEVPAGATIGTCASAAEDWGQHGYFQRFSRVSLAATGEPVDGLFLVRRLACAAPPGCSRVVTSGELMLFRCDAASKLRTRLAVVC
jgi:hypothetical protein